MMLKVIFMNATSIIYSIHSPWCYKS